MMERSARPSDGVVLQMQDYSIHDGAGVRTTIFLAGCALRCAWCANPETWTRRSKLAFYAHKCVDCRTCLTACPAHLDPRTVTAYTAQCRHCGQCVSACPSSALAMACERVTAQQVAAQIERDALFFRYTGGGVTFSGGEPFLQPAFLRAVIAACEPLGVTFWAETSAHFSWRQAAPLLGCFEHVFCDIKHMDSAQHRRFTGVGNERILSNIKAMYQAGVALTVRVPFIPEVNGDETNMRATAAFMQANLPGVGVELLAYHELGNSKFAAFKMAQPHHEFSIPTQAQLTAAYAIFAQYGVAPSADE